MAVYEVWDRALSIDVVMAAVAHPTAGAVVFFCGAVRDHNDGRAVTKLEYEAYAAMAEREMAHIGAEIERESPGVRLSALHRVGSLSVGELAVLCAASAPHRAEAFVACERLIDEVKARVPVWKREWGADGPYWLHWEDARCTGEHTDGHKECSGG